MKRLLFIIFGSLFIISCAEEPNFTPIELTIDRIEPTESYGGDTLTIFGSGFGDGSDSSYVVIDSIYIPYSYTLKWGITAIQVIVPDTIETELIEVFVKIDSLTSNKVELNYWAFPFDYSTVEIPSGQFTRGSYSGSPDELPARVITISKPLTVFSSEVSQKLYQALMKKNPSRFKGEALPVDSLSWRDAIEFCNELSRVQGLQKVYEITDNDVVWLPDSNGWRLPTEAEWEYLCKAGTNDDFGNKNLTEIAWYNQNSGLKTHNVGTKQPNDFGLYDIHGNVWEWCWDRYSFKYYEESPETDPQGPAAGTRRVLRGGSWNDGPTFLRASNRSLPQGTERTAGLRPVRNK